MPISGHTHPPTFRRGRALRSRLATLEQTVYSHQRTIDALYRIAALVLREQPLTEMLQDVAREVSACTDCPFVAIELYDVANQQMELAAAIGAPLTAGLIGHRVSVEQALSGRVARSGKAVIETYGQEQTAYDGMLLHQPGVRTIVCVPLCVTEQVLGTLSLARPDAISPDASLITLIHSLANLIAALVARRQTEAKLKVALTKYHTLFDSFPLGITVSDAKGQIVETNTMAERLLGIGREEHTQRTIDGAEWQIIHSDGSPMPTGEYASVRALREQRLIENVEMGVLTPSGGTTWINVTAAPLPLDDYGVVITYGDITERRQTEALVKAQRDLARMIATATTSENAWPHCLELAVRVSGMDSGGIYLFDASEQVLELACHQGLSADFLTSTARYSIDAPNARRMRAGQSSYLSVEDIRQNELYQNEGLSCVAIMPIRHQEQVLGCVNLGSHSQQQVPPFARRALETMAAEIGNMVIFLRSESALRLSEEHYRGLMESLDSAVITVDAAGRLLYLNDVTAGLIGKTTKQLIGKTLDEIFPGPVAQAQLAAVHQVIQADRGAIFEVQMLIKDQPRWYRISLQPIHDNQGRVAHALINATDIDDIKTAQQQLLELNQTLEERVAQRSAEVYYANTELARAARAKDEFLANMSHELRTPLNTILAMSESLQDAIYDPLTERQQGAIRHIESSGRYLLSLINDILDLSKIEAGRLALEIDQIIIADVCQASLLFVRELAIKKSLQLDMRLGNDLSIMEADPRRIKQILVNLLSNAVKFTPNGGQVSLEVACDIETGVVRFAVRDTGIGIAPEDQARLFQAFSQIDSTLSRQHEGSGLGLALVRRLAELHRGSVTIESEVGVGSCFTITLPLRQSEPMPPPEVDSRLELQAVSAGNEPVQQTTAQQPSVDPASRGLRVLLTDDNEDNTQVIDTYLRARGYDVVTAHSGQEALDRIGVVNPAVILMDIQMPDLDGLEVIRRMRASAAHKTTPIIALTALAMAGDRERCLAAGATAYLAKPISLKKLATLIAQVTRA